MRTPCPKPKATPPNSTHPSIAPTYPAASTRQLWLVLNLPLNPEVEKISIRGVPKPQWRHSEDEAKKKPTPQECHLSIKQLKNRKNNTAACFIFLGSPCFSYTAFAFKIIGLYFINKTQKIVGNIRYFLFKKSLLRRLPLPFGKSARAEYVRGTGLGF